MTEATARFALPLLQSGQAQKEVFHNEAITRLDASLHPAVETISRDSPPERPAVGMAWIVGSGGAGAWLDRAGCLATWTPGGWRFATPVPGMQVWLKELGRWIWHDGAAWRDEAWPVAGIQVEGVRVVGARRPAIATPIGGGTVDAEARSALSDILGALRQHGLIAT